jgi:hypothetical protein
MAQMGKKLGLAISLIPPTHSLWWKGRNKNGNISFSYADCDQLLVPLLLKTFPSETNLGTAGETED